MMSRIRELSISMIGSAIIITICEIHKFANLSTSLNSRILPDLQYYILVYLL